MPTSVDEKIWNRAKAEARQMGKQDNYAYIMHVYQQMKDSNKIEKSKGPALLFQKAKLPLHAGQLGNVVRGAGLHVFPRDVDPTRAPRKDSATLLLRHTNPVMRMGAIAKNLGLSLPLERKINGAIEKRSRASKTEIDFRQEVYDYLTGVSELERAQKRAVFQRSLTFWRTTKERKALYKSTPTPKPALQLPHKMAVRGRADPTVMGDTRRSLPGGTVRVHYSQDRGGFVRAMKMTDGTWKILGKIGKKHEPDGDEAKKVPHLPSHEEHHESPPPGKEPIHDKKGNKLKRVPITMGV